MIDPPTQHRAASLAGTLAAEGRIDGAEVLAAIQHAGRAAAPGADAAGLCMRLAHRFHDARRAAARARWQARARIAWALAPLLAARAPGEALIAAADAADPAQALSQAERRHEVETAILRTLHRSRRR